MLYIFQHSEETWRKKKATQHPTQQAYEHVKRREAGAEKGTQHGGDLLALQGHRHSGHWGWGDKEGRRHSSEQLPISQVWPLPPGRQGQFLALRRPAHDPEESILVGKEVVATRMGTQVMVVLFLTASELQLFSFKKSPVKSNRRSMKSSNPQARHEGSHHSKTNPGEGTKGKEVTCATCFCFHLKRPGLCQVEDGALGPWVNRNASRKA